MRVVLPLVLLSLLFAACAKGTKRYADANFPDTIAIAPIDEALTFARAQIDGETRLLAIGAFNDGEVTAFNLSADTKHNDPIALYNELGYDALRDRITVGLHEDPVQVDAKDLVIPADLNDAHIAAGTNFAAHAEESSVEDGPFLFAKPVKPTPHNATVSAGDALLDYEVELAFITLADTPLDEVPETMGLILANDFTDRATLLRLINTDDVTSGDGFATGKGGEGYLPVGNLFVIPRDFESFANNLDLKLAVNGKLRQQAPMTLAIWDIHELFRQIQLREDTRWTHNGEEIGLPLNNGAIPARTLILAGTPDGTVFAGIPKSTMAAGALRWLAGGWGQPLPQHVIERYIKSAKKKRNFLQPGDTVTIHVDTMGTLSNNIE